MPATLLGMADRLGDLIRAARERRGLTQQELAHEVGVARETVGNWETGVSTPRNKMGRLREVLGDDLSGIVGAPDQDAGVLLSLPPSALEGLSEAEREEITATAKASALERAREIRRRLDQP
jgi:transcriptional regulator with XRE-family HTH domain